MFILMFFFYFFNVTLNIPTLSKLGFASVHLQVARLHVDEGLERFSAWSAEQFKRRNENSNLH